MPTNLTDRLGELIGHAENGRISARGALVLLVLDHKDEILSALRKAEAPASGYYAELAGRLRQMAPRYSQTTGEWVFDVFCNRDGEEAATAIERLTAREAELVEELAKLIHAGDSFCALFREMERLEATRARLSLGDEK